MEFSSYQKFDTKSEDTTGDPQLKHKNRFFLSFLKTSRFRHRNCIRHTIFSLWAGKQFLFCGPAIQFYFSLWAAKNLVFFSWKACEKRRSEFSRIRGLSYSCICPTNLPFGSIAQTFLDQAPNDFLKRGVVILHDPAGHQGKHNEQGGSQFDERRPTERSSH